jgi:iron complex transport system substrate-binding protein
MIRQDDQKKPDFYLGLKAFTKKEVYILHSFKWYLTNIGTVVADAYAVGTILYPEKFRDIKPDERADQIYEFLLGKSVYQEMAGNFGGLGEVPGYVGRR